MPKLEKKILTATLYTYVKPENNKWVRTQAKQEGISYSHFMDKMIDRARWRTHAPVKKSAKTGRASKAA